MKLTESKNWVDTHFHVFNAGVAIDQARYVPQYNAALQDWIELAKGVGVKRGVCVQPSFLGTDNSLLVSAIQQQPDALRGVAVVAVDIQSEELKTLHASGVRGIRLNLSGVDHDISEWRRAERLWQMLHDLGWHLEVHTNQGALPKVLAQLPSNISLVVDHMAKPSEAKARDATVQGLAQRAQHTPTYIKLSGAYRLGGVDATQVAHIWLHELGPQALLWGSDWPCTNHEQLAHYPSLLTPLESWLGTDNFEVVLSHNPQRLYWGY